MDSQTERQFYKFRDSRQERIHQRLKLVGAGLPDYFKDACRLRDTQPLFETTTHLVGHLIREIESSIRAVLLVFAQSTDKPRNETHNWEIRQILRGLEISDDDQIALLWLRHAPRLAHGRAHRDNLNRPRPVDEEFLEYIDEMESIFDVILSRFESKYLTVHAALDAKLLIQNPTTDDANWLKKNVPNNEAALGYFFQRLTNPNWLDPLKSEGLFDRPPEPIYEPEKNTTYYPQWPQSKYLIGMATVQSDEVRTKVADILLGIETTNFIIHLDIIDATLFLPVDLASRIAEKETEWLQGQRFAGHLIPDKFAGLTVYLADGYKADAALAIASTALSFVDIEDKELTAAENYFGREPRTRIDRWDYGQFIHKTWESLCRANWQGSLELFCGLLSEYIRRKYPERVESGESFSYIWHRAIEHDEDGLPNRLLSTIRSIAEKVMIADSSSLSGIIKILESYRWDVFERIVLHLLCQHPAGAEPEIKNRLLSDVNFRNPEFFHEYVVLLATFFKILEDAEQETILSWIDNSAASIEEIKRRRFEWDGTELSDDVAEKSIRARKLRWLEPLKDVLPKEWREKYETWTAELGHPDHPGYVIGAPQITWGAEPEPIAKVLSEFQSVEEIVDYLRAPTSESSESPQNLGRELSQLVISDIPRFVPEAKQFEGLAPNYVRSFVSGVRSSAEPIPETTWPNLLHLLNWVMEQPAAEINLSENSYDSPDSNWVQTRGEIGDLLSSIFSKETPEVPFQLRGQIWSILRALTDDPNPTPEYEAKYGGTNMDPFTVSLNTTRGRAFHTLIKYLYWCRQQLNSEDGLKSANEVREVLERHLDPNIDSSLAVRSVYGERLPSLVSIDPEWVREHQSLIFPVEEGLNDFRKSAWETFIIYTRPWDNVFDVLKEQYEKAIERLGEASLYKSESSANHLAEHLTVFYARGKIGIEDGGLLDKFYASATDKLCAHVFWFIGRILKEDEIPREAVERLAHLVLRRIAKGQTHPIEMEAFGWVLASRKLDPEWSLLRLRDALEISPSSDGDHFIIETLSELAPTFPRTVLGCVTRLVEGADTDWKVSYWSPHIRVAIAAAIEKGELDLATVLVNKLAALGLVEFRDLLPGY